MGYFGMLTVTPTTIVLSHRKNSTEILINEITAISFTKAGLFNKGCLRFSFRGGMGRTAVGRLNYNALLFKRKQEPGILQAKAMIDHYRAAYQANYRPVSTNFGGI